MKTTHFFNNQDDAELVCQALNMISDGPTLVVASGPDEDYAVMPMAEAYDMQIPSRVVFADGSGKHLGTETDTVFPQLPANDFQIYGEKP